MIRVVAILKLHQLFAKWCLLCVIPNKCSMYIKCPIKYANNFALLWFIVIVTSFRGRWMWFIDAYSPCFFPQIVRGFLFVYMFVCLFHNHEIQMSQQRSFKVIYGLFPSVGHCGSIDAIFSTSSRDPYVVSPSSMTPLTIELIFYAHKTLVTVKTGQLKMV